MRCEKIKHQLSLIEIHRGDIRNAEYKLSCYVSLYNKELRSLKAVKKIYLLVCKESWNKKDVKAIYEPVRVLYEEYKERVCEYGKRIKYLKQYIKKHQRCISRMDLFK